MAVVIGVAGGSGAGKSAVVHALAPRLGSPGILDLDSYYLDRSAINSRDRSSINYDEPAAFDLPLILEHLRALTAGQSVLKPRYSFATHTRIGSDRVAPAPVIMVDGLFVLWWEDLRARCDLKIFVDVPADVRLVRRLMRDVVERGRTMESVVAQYLRSVRPMHERYIEPTRTHADLIVTNEGALDTATAVVHKAARSFAVEMPRDR